MATAKKVSPSARAAKPQDAVAMLKADHRKVSAQKTKNDMLAPGAQMGARKQDLLASLG